VRHVNFLAAPAAFFPVPLREIRIRGVVFVSMPRRLPWGAPPEEKGITVKCTFGPTMEGTPDIEDPQFETWYRYGTRKSRYISTPG
jgi:hypothetical protein